LTEKAGGKYIMFLDADMIMSPGLIESCMLESGAKGLIGLQMPEIVIGKRFFSKVRRFERVFYNGTCIDGCRFFLKSTFITAGGFDENLNAFEDWDLEKRLKKVGKTGYLKSVCRKEDFRNWELTSFLTERGVSPECYENSIFHNESEFELKKYLSKKAYYAKSYKAYIGKWGKSDPDIKKQFGLFYRYFGVFIENGKWIRLISHPVLTLGMYFLRILVGLTYLRVKSMRN
jgi:glycosyltransferase involved in cell wall biosynthesis